MGRYIITVKERVRGTYGTLPFISIPTHMIFELVYNSVFWINDFPYTYGIHKQSVQEYWSPGKRLIIKNISVLNLEVMLRFKKTTITPW